MGVPISQKIEMRFRMTQALPKPDNTQQETVQVSFPGDASAGWGGAQGSSPAKSNGAGLCPRAPDVRCAL